MPIARVHNFSVSLDGFGCGDHTSREAPFGHAGRDERPVVERLMSWYFPTGTCQAMMNPGEPRPMDEAAAFDDRFARSFGEGIGAEIMGAGKFGFPGWHEDADWQGWWGDDPPFHTPVFVLTHQPREVLELEGGNVFHFLDATPAEALERAFSAAGGLDVRIGGGPSVVRDFLAAGLIDRAHIVQVPVLLGSGVRVWDGLADLEAMYDIVPVSSPSGVTHLTLTRRGA